MPKIAQLIGGAGTGKTSELLRLMESVLEKLFDPHLIGFCSFTRAARREASSRAADRFNLKPRDLEDGGWFKTLHAIAYRCLGAGKELLTGNAADRLWLQESLQEDVAASSDSIEQDLADPFGGDNTDAGTALMIWDVARNRLLPYDEVWRQVDEFADRTPDLAFCQEVVDRYEQSKRLDHRVDFTDLLARFAGYRLSPAGAEPCEPDGQPPDLPCWFIDESQDTSPLAHAVQLRLIAQPAVQWVYVAADPFQSLYTWAGADPQCFLTGFGPTAKRRTMPKSYRCPGPILALGEAILRECSDYFDRKIAPADHEGIVESMSLEEGLAEIDPREDWLVLTRTNLLASRVARALDEDDTPWLPMRGGGTWNAPVRGEAIAALTTLEAGSPIDGREWQSILKFLPTKIPAGPLLEHGTKARFAAMSREQAQADYPWMFTKDLLAVGATPLFVKENHAFRSWIPGALVYTGAVARWGQEAVDKPGVRIGTVHSAKGAEADNVAVLTTIPLLCYRAAQSDEGFDAEQRVKYVAVTRARKRVVILHEANPRYRWRMEG